MRNILIVLLSFIFISLSAQEKKSFQLSSHILDISKGKPVEDVFIELQKYNDNTKQWDSLDKKKTDKNGRITDFLPYHTNEKNNKGNFKLVFFIEEYYNKQNIESFYPYIEVIFQIKDQEHYHVPITLSPFGYSTYRGS